MSADNRTVTTDALETLGFILDDSAKRDAIHLAVEPVVAGQELCPGINVKLIDGTAFAPDHKDEECVGIVDPFLGQNVQKGERFWLVVYPRQITSLRHVWEHPGIDNPIKAEAKAKVESEAWLRDFIKHSDAPDYESLIAGLTGKPRDPSDWAYEDYGADYLINDGTYLTIIGSDASGKIPSEFWDHVETVTGMSFPANERAEYFSCSC